MSTTAQMTDILPEVSAFLASTPLRLFIGGQWIDAADGGRFATLDPGTGEPLADIAEGTARDIHRAVQSATKAFRYSRWAAMPVHDRAAILHRLADLVIRDGPVLAQLESLDVGKPIGQAAAFDVPNVAQTLRYYADLAVDTRMRVPIRVDRHEAYTARSPYGVCAFVLPWNFPLLLLGWAFAPALAAGNTVVLKPAEDAPLSSLYFCRLAQEAGVPDGVINVVPGFGEVAGAALASHPGIQRMGFTGSPEVGRKIAAVCGANLVPVKLELGGKGAAVVFDDADLPRTAAGLAAAIALNSGQVCCTATRWVIHEPIVDSLVNRVKEILTHLSIGHGLDPHTDMGPVVSEKQRQRVLGYIDRGFEEGARALLEGGPAQVVETPKGFYVKPCLLTGPADNICAREEIFGPVAYVTTFRDEKEAVDLVNQSAYGLANSVWTSDLDRAQRVAEAMHAGNSWINAHNVFQQGIPYAGCKLSGLGGGVLGPDTLLDYLCPQSIVRPLE
jgi:acyl-CoA reductase-like NAD-dependent aldehyde dehydrogenase